MEPLSDDKLIEDALAIIEGIDFETLSAAISASAPPTSSAEEILLDEAIKSVRAAFPHNSHQTPMPAAPLQGGDPEYGEKQDQPALFRNTSYEQSESANALRVLIAAADEADRPSPGNKGRVRVREQLIRLRDVVKRMESHLKILKSPCSTRLEVLESEEAKAFSTDENASSEANVLGGLTDEAAMWRNIAIQQFRARRRAEHQNAELRENLATHARLSKQVESLLQMQELHHGLIQHVGDEPSSNQAEEPKSKHADGDGNDA